jgi:hypothetical protein
MIAAALCPTAARAHDTQLAGLRVIVGSGTTLVSVMTHQSQLAAADGVSAPGADDAALDRSIRRRLKVRLDGAPFVPAAVSVIRDPQNDLIMWQSRCPKEAASVEVLARLYPNDPASKLVVSVVRGGVTVQESILDAEHPALLAHPGAPAPPRRRAGLSIALRYVREGVSHVFGGLDHVAFLLGLLLLGGTLRSLLKTVTAFTLAHSLTLGIAAAGVWCPSPRMVEPLIALSILYIAAENLAVGLRRRSRPEAERTPRRDLRPLLAFGFGLIHGFGFAGALSSVGLPQDAFWLALGAFNLGVEVAQAAIIVTVAPLLTVLARGYPALHRRAVNGGSIIIGLAGIYWLCIRLLTP